MIGSDQGPDLDALWKVLSRERLEGGYGGGAMPRQDVIVRYLWNVALCESLYPSLQSLEVALRNTLFNAGEAVYPFTGTPAEGQIPCWLDIPGVLLGEEPKRVAAAKRHLRETNKPLEPGRVVAELTFGFWTALFDVRYENTRVLWPRLFGQKIFADAPRNRGAAGRFRRCSIGSGCCGTASSTTSRSGTGETCRPSTRWHST